VDAGEVAPHADVPGELVELAANVRPDLLPRIFDPYFSTHESGTGLGLPIARRIAEKHGGAIKSHNRPEGGLEAVITIPCEPVDVV
jgi:signal transduction histidine kinase